jgi:hypothetical protein
VEDFPGWYYGLLVRHKDNSVTFDVYESGGGRKIEDLHCANGYRRASTARMMGLDGPGYQEIAQDAIRALDD